MLVAALLEQLPRRLEPGFIHMSHPIVTELFSNPEKEMHFEKRNQAEEVNSCRRLIEIGARHDPCHPVADQNEQVLSTPQDREHFRERGRVGNQICDNDGLCVVLHNPTFSQDVCENKTRDGFLICVFDPYDVEAAVIEQLRHLSCVGVSEAGFRSEEHTSELQS